AATAEGLGTCWIGVFDEKELRELLKIPLRLRVVALLALGYAGGKLDLPAKLAHLIRPRKQLEKIAYLEEYGQKFLGHNAPRKKRGSLRGISPRGHASEPSY
ncbi:MAG: nitroreductase family protein, partial [Candidatus Bathyarchaeia archaeon]